MAVNDKIKELITASGLDYHDLWTKDQLAVDKLAELIIQQCLHQIDKNFVGAVGTYASAHNSAVLKCQKNVKQHFGISE